MSGYLDDSQCAEVARLKKSWLWRSEAPTWVLIVVIYGGWYLTLANWKYIGLPAATGILIAICAWFTSLQHELLHGHPTRWVWLNRLIGYPPLAVWEPYTIYRDTHIRHHRNEDLTFPGLDPESYFVTPEKWKTMGRMSRAILRLRNTMLGRLSVGAFLGCFGPLNASIKEFKQGEYRYLPMWLCHICLLILMLKWMDSSFDMSPIYYLVFIAYPAKILTMVRSFYEHRPSTTPEHRSVVNETGWVWRLLFLNNNYHVVHHDLPSIPWYGIPGIYWGRRLEYISRSGGFIVRGYGELLRKFSLKEVIDPVHSLSEDFVES